MSITNWKTWASGDILTAADMNTYQRDNGRWLSHNATGGAPIGRFTHSAAQTAFTTGNPSAFNTTVFAAGGLAIASSVQLTMPADGKYLIGGSLQLTCTFLSGNSNVIGSIGTSVGGDTRIAQQVATAQFTTTHYISLSALYAATAGDYFRLWLDFNNYTNVDIAHVADRSPEFWAAWIGE